MSNQFSKQEQSDADKLNKAFASKLDAVNAVMAGSAVDIPTGTLADRPTSPPDFTFYGCTDLEQLQIYIAGVWYPLTGTSGTVAPGPVGNFQGVASSPNSVNLTWNTPTTGTQPFVYAVMYRVTGTTAWNAFTNTSANSISVTGLQAGTQYDFQIITTGQAAPSSTSAIVQVTTQYVSPSKPLNVTVGTVTSTTAATSWTAPTTGTQPLSYVAKATDGAGHTISSPPLSDTNYTFTGLTPATAYTITVTASNPGGSATSDPASATTQAAAGSAPSEPTNLLATNITANGLTLSWTASSEGTGVSYQPEWAAVSGSASSTPLPPLFVTGNMYWGAAGHRDQSNAYTSIPLSQQISDLKTVFGGTQNSVVYRAEGDGATTGFGGDITNLQAAGIIPIVMAITYPDWSSLASESAAYAWAYGAVQALVQQAPTNMVWEIGNEWVLQDPLFDNTNGVGRWTGDGSVASDWTSIPGYPKTRGAMAGAIAAIRDHAPAGAQIIGGALGGWTFVGYACALAADLRSYAPQSGRNLMWDFTCVHWYNDTAGGDNQMGNDPSNFNGGMNIFELLKPCGVPTYFTEFGSSTVNNTSHEAQAGTNIVGIMTSLAAHSAVTATECGCMGGTVYQMYQMPGVQTDYYLYRYSSGSSGSIATQGSDVRAYVTAHPGVVSSAGIVRQPYYQPGSAQSVWNTPRGSGAVWSSASDADQIDLTSLSCAMAYGSQNGTPVYIGKSSDPVITISSPAAPPPTTLTNWWQNPGGDGTYLKQPIDSNANWITSGSMVTAVRNGLNSQPTGLLHYQTGDFSVPMYVGTASDPVVTVTDGTKTIQVHLPVGAAFEQPGDFGIGGYDTTQPYLMWCIGVTSMTDAHGNNVTAVNGPGCTIHGNLMDVSDASGPVLMDQLTRQPGTGNTYALLQEYELQQALADPNYVCEHTIAYALDYRVESSGGPVWPLWIIDTSFPNSGAVPQGLTIGIPASTPYPSSKVGNRAFKFWFDVLQRFGGFYYNQAGSGCTSFYAYPLSSETTAFCEQLQNELADIMALVCILNPGDQSSNYTSGPAGAQYSLDTMKGKLPGQPANPAFPAPAPLDLSPTGGQGIQPSRFGAFYPGGYNTIWPNTGGSGGSGGPQYQRDPGLTAQVHCPANATIGANGKITLFDLTQPNKIWSGVQCTFNNGSNASGGITCQRLETDLTCQSMEDATTGNYGYDSALGLIRNYDLAQGKIQHMLSWLADPSLMSDNPTAWDQSIAWPDTHADYGRPGYTGSIQPGVTIGIPADVNLDTLGLTTGGRILANALQQFGAIWRGTMTGGVTFPAEQAIDSQYLPLLQQMQQDCPKILPKLRIMRNQSASSKNGGGTPLFFAPPPLDVSVCPGSTGGGSGGAPSTFQPIGSPTTGTSAVITGLQPNTSYAFEVVASNSQGSATSEIIFVTTTSSGGGTGPSTPTTTWDSAHLAGPITLSSNKLTATTGGSTTPNSTPQGVLSTSGKTTGTWWFEITATKISNDFCIGLANTQFELDLAGGLGADGNGIGYYPVSPTQGIYYAGQGLTYGDGDADVTGATFTVVVDIDNELFWVTSPAMRASVGASAWNNSLSANPATKSGGISFSGMSGTKYICFNNLEGGSSALLNTGASASSITIPAGAQPWDPGTGGGSGGNSNGTPQLLGPASGSVITNGAVSVSGISLTDSSATGTCTLSIACSQGTVTSTVAGSPVNGSGTRSISYSNTLANCQTVAANLVYTAGSQAGSDNIGVTFTDNLGQSATIHIPITITASSGAQGWTVRNGKIIAPNGQNFTVAGLNIDTNATADDVHNLFPGINFIRFPCGDLSITPESIADFVRSFTSRGDLFEIEYHPFPLINPLTGSALQTEAAWYAAMADYFIDDINVCFGTMNEPQGSGAGITDEQVAVYNAIRNTGSKALIFMSCGVGSGNPGAVGAAVLNASAYATMFNIVWDQHFYGWAANGSTNLTTVRNAYLGSVASSTGLLAAQGIRSADGVVPVVNGEFGPATNGDAGPDANASQVEVTVGQWAVQNGYSCGFAGWHWDADQYNAVQHNGALDTWGNALAGYIAAVAQSSGGSGTPPLVQSPLTGNVQQGTWQYGDFQSAGMPHGSLHYALLLPHGYTSAVSYPVVVYMHQNTEGNSWYESGGDPTVNTIVYQDVIDGFFNSIQYRTDHPSIVVVPFCDQTDGTGGTGLNFGGYADTPGDNVNENAVARLVQYLWANLSCYQPKTFVTGQSLGGTGTIAQMLDYNRINGPIGKVWTAGLCLSGQIVRSPDPATDSATLARMASVPLFCIAGSGDDGPSTGANNNAYERPVYQHFAGNSNYPKPPGAMGGTISGCRAGSSNYYYAEDTTLGHDVWSGNPSGHNYGLYPNDAQPFWQWLFSQEVA